MNQQQMLQSMQHQQRLGGGMPSQQQPGQLGPMSFMPPAGLTQPMRTNPASPLLSNAGPSNNCNSTMGLPSPLPGPHSASPLGLPPTLRTNSTSSSPGAGTGSAMGDIEALMRKQTHDQQLMQMRQQQQRMDGFMAQQTGQLQPPMQQLQQSTNKMLPSPNMFTNDQQLQALQQQQQHLQQQLMQAQ
jgi:hypothetical protein